MATACAVERLPLEDVLLWWSVVYSVTVDCPWCRRSAMRVDLHRRDVCCAACGRRCTLEQAIDARADAEMRAPLSR